MTAASAIPVAIHGFSVNSALLAIANLLIGGALVTWIKTRPKMQENASAQRKDELEALRDRVDDLEKQINTLLETVSKADERAHAAEMRLVKEGAMAESKLSSAVTAVQLVIEALREKDAEHPAIRQAQKLIELAASNDSGFGRFIGQLSSGQVASGNGVSQ